MTPEMLREVRGIAQDEVNRILKERLHSEYLRARSVLPQKIRPTTLAGARPSDGSPLVYSEDSDLVTFEGAANTLHRPLGIYQSASSAGYQSIGASAWENVDFNAALYAWMDASDYVISGGDASSDNHIVVPRDGIYQVDGCIAFTSNATDSWRQSRAAAWDGSTTRVVAWGSSIEEQIGNGTIHPFSAVADLYADEVVLAQAFTTIVLSLRSNFADGIPYMNYVQITYLGPIPE